MKFLFVAFGLLIQIIFYFKREWLFDRKSFFWLFLSTIALFIVGFLLKKLNIGDRRYVVLLENPLPTLVIFYVLKTIYMRIYNQIPVDTFWSMDIKLMKDGIFNFLFWLIGGAGGVLFVVMVLN